MNTIEILNKFIEKKNKKATLVCLTCRFYPTCNKSEVNSDPAVNKCSAYEKNQFVSKEILKKRLKLLEEYIRETTEKQVDQAKKADSYYKVDSSSGRFKTISSVIVGFFKNEAKYKNDRIASQNLSWLADSQSSFRTALRSFDNVIKDRNMLYRDYSSEEIFILYRLLKCLTKQSLEKFKRRYPKESKIIFKSDRRLYINSKKIEGFFIDICDTKIAGLTKKELKQKFDKLRSRKRKIDFYRILLNDLDYTDFARAECEIGGMTTDLIMVSDYEKLRIFKKLKVY